MCSLLLEWKFSSFVKIPLKKKKKRKKPLYGHAKHLELSDGDKKISLLPCFPQLILSLAFCFKGMEGSLLEGSTLKYTSPTKKYNLPSRIYKSCFLHIRCVIVNRKHILLLPFPCKRPGQIFVPPLKPFFPSVFLPTNFLRQVLWVKWWLRIFFSPLFLSRLQFASCYSMEWAAPNRRGPSFVSSALCLVNRWWRDAVDVGTLQDPPAFFWKEKGCREEQRLKIL